MSTTILNLISGPRNVSTALMYSFAQRGDTAVVDEPLYGHYLKLTHAPQPHWDELIKILETDGDKVVRETILSPPPGKTAFFIKGMAHHLIELDLSWLRLVTNIFLIRDPEQMLPSLINQVTEPTERDAGYRDQARIFRQLRDDGQQPIVLDSKEVLIDPEGVLRKLCRRVGLAFDEAMLRWEPGPRPEDGPWAKWWYHNLHKSTGFAPYQEKSAHFPERLKPLLEKCRPHYELLATSSIRAIS